jgi:hypothetical protein
VGTSIHYKKISSKVYSLISFTVQFLGGSAKLKNATISFDMSVCPSSICPHGTTLHLSRKPLKLAKIKGTLHDDLRTFIRSCLILLRMTNDSDESCRENQNAFFCLTLFPPENLAVYEIMWKCVVQPDRPQMTIQRRKDATCVPDN